MADDVYTEFYQTRVTAKRLMTIPIEVREFLGVKPGDRIAFVEENGEIFVEKAPEVSRTERDVESSKYSGSP
jgi:AbrB family looped-hinge helix DNA binding protein